MRSILVFTLLVGSVIAQACKLEVPDFRAVSTDGKIRSRAALAGKPTLFVFLKLGCPSNPEAIPKFNRLAASLKGKVEVVGIINSDLVSAKKYAKELKIGFPMIPDPKKSVIKGFGAKRSLEMTYTAPKTKEAKYPKLWDGYSRSMVQEVLDGIGHHGVKVPKLNLSYFLVAKRAGCSL